MISRLLPAQKGRATPLSRTTRALGDGNVTQTGWGFATKSVASLPNASAEVGCSSVAMCVDGTTSLRMTVVNVAVGSTVTELTGERACRAWISHLAVSSSCNEVSQPPVQVGSQTPPRSVTSRYAVVERRRARLDPTRARRVRRRIAARAHRGRTRWPRPDHSPARTSSCSYHARILDDLRLWVQR